MVESVIVLTQTYAFWGTVALIVCYPIAFYNMQKIGLSFPQSIILITVGVYGGLLGGRIFYIALFYPNLLYENLIFLISFWQKTGTWLGAPIGIFVLFLISTSIMKKPFWITIGSFTPAMVLAHAISRIGCIMAGCCHGSKTDVFWAIYSERLKCYTHPTQLYSTLGEFISFIILQLYWRDNNNRKYVFPIYLILLATHRFFSEIFRGSEIDNFPFLGLRIFQVVCIGLFLFGCTSIIWLRKKGKVS